jgi:hypothetical protein
MKNILKILSISLFLFISSFGINIARAVTPTILGITSTTLDGTYKAGDIVNITLNFSEPITSTGDVIVTLETGTIDRTCTFQVVSSNTASCNYTVQTGDTSVDLNVNTIVGVLKNAVEETMVNMIPDVNLATNKAFVIDTTPITITNITSSKADGVYITGDVIDLNITFSKTISTDIVNRTNAGSRIWYSVTSSSDGTKLAAIDSAYIYTSTDSGVTWSQRMSASPYPQIRRVGKLISNDSTIIPYSFSNITS